MTTLEQMKDMTNRCKVWAKYAQQNMSWLDNPNERKWALLCGPACTAIAALSVQGKGEKDDR